MPAEPFMPITANLVVVLVAFVVLLLVFDILLVRWKPLGKVAWKRVDYIWLGFAALGLLGSVAEVRMASASAQVAMYEVRVVAAFRAVQSLVNLDASTPGAICRTFIRSAFSPPPDEFQRVQNEYNVACDWVKSVHAIVAELSPSPPQRLDSTRWPPRPQVSDGALLDMFRGLDRQMEYWSRSFDSFEAVRAKSRATAAEETIMFLGPFLLAVALALRITKVTGEIRLEA